MEQKLREYIKKLEDKNAAISRKLNEDAPVLTEETRMIFLTSYNTTNKIIRELEQLF